MSPRREPLVREAECRRSDTSGVQRKSLTVKSSTMKGAQALAGQCFWRRHRRGWRTPDREYADGETGHTAR